MVDHSRRPKSRRAIGLQDGVFWGDIMSEYGHLSLEAFNKGRTGEKAIHRHILATYLFGQGWVTMEIGALLNRDHATIVHSVSKVLDAVELGDKVVLSEIARIQHLEAEKLITQALEVDALVLLQKAVEERCGAFLEEPIAGLEKRTISPWILISDVAPADVTPVLVYGECCDICYHIEIAEVEEGHWWRSGSGENLVFKPKYWAPLPIPPGKQI